MLQDALGAEHFFIDRAEKFDLFIWMHGAVSDLGGFIARVVCLHWQALEYLVVNRQCIHGGLVRALVVWTLDHVVVE